MEKADVYKKIRNLLSQLTEEHKKLLASGEALYQELDTDINKKILDSIKEFILKVDRHAYIEENDLYRLINEAGIDEFDTEALNFGHRTLEEIEEHIIFLIDNFLSSQSLF